MRRYEMPKLRDNLKGAVLRQAEPEVSEVREVQLVPSAPKQYTKRSPILRTYQAGLMPTDHRILLGGIKHELGDAVSAGQRG